MGQQHDRLRGSEDRLAKLNSVENAKFSIKGSERQADLVQLQNENNLLRQQVDYWKGQTKRTESVTTDKKSVLKAARSLVKHYSFCGARTGKFGRVQDRNNQKRSTPQNNGL